MRRPSLRVVALAACLSACGPGYAPPEPPAIDTLPSLGDESARATIEAATAAVQHDERSAAKWSALGRAYEVQDLHERAEECYAAAGALDSNDARAPYRAAVVAGRQGELERAISHASTALERDAGYGPAWRRRGLWRLELGEIDAARRDVERATELLPGLADGPLARARIELLADDVDSALSYAELAHRRAPDDRYVRQILGTALRRAGRSEEARTHLAAGEGAQPRYADPWSLEIQSERLADEELGARAAELESEGDFRAAARLYRQLAEARPNDWGVVLRLGLALARSGDEDGALDVLQDGAERFPAQHDLASAHVNALRTKGRRLEALEAAEAVIARWPEEPDAYLARGALMRDDGDEARALADFTRATRVAPEDPRGRLFAAQLHVRAQRYQEAASVLAAGLENPEAAPPLPYFDLLLRALARSGADRAMLDAVLQRARQVHGSGAESLLRPR